MNWSYSLAWIEYELAELATGVQIPVGPYQIIFPFGVFAITELAR